MRIRKAVTFLFTLVGSMLMTAIAFAEEAVAQESAGGMTDAGVKALAAALVLGISASCGALGQAKAASTALEGIARNPNAAGKLFTPMLLSLALIESLVIYALLIAFLIK